MTRLAIAALACLALLAVAGCGDDDEDTAATPTATAPRATTPPPTTATAPAPEPTGTEIKLAGSQFGRILFDGRGQAIYLFTRDQRNRTRCFGECADEWPPVYTRGEPRAAGGVQQRLLGTIRRNGRLQVTYNGHPLYFYAHEDREQVLCHDVEGFGGTWLVVQRNGQAVG